MSRPPPLQVAFRLGRDEVTISAGGEIDLATATDLTALVDAVAGRGRNRLIFDLGDVVFMDVTGLNLLAGLAHRLRAAGGNLVVRSPSTLTGRLFELAGLGDLVETGPAGLDAAGLERSAGAGGAVVRSLDDMRAASTRARRRIIDDALALVVAWAAAAVTSADSVSVTVARRGRLTTAASSDDVSARLDGDQYATGEGPCVHAATRGEQALVASTAEDARWPRFLPHALGAGITAILSTPLTVASEPVGALNLYSRSEEGFGADQPEMAALIAGQAARVLAGVSDDVTAAESVGRLQDALRAREVIALAQGVVMQRDGLTPGGAAANLRSVSRRADVSLRQVATDLVARFGEANDPSRDG